MAFVREQNYNEVFDAQAHFRSLLDSMARPGKINVFPKSEIDPPREFSVAAAYLAFALLNRDVSYYCAYDTVEIEEYLRINTSCLAAELKSADFLFVKSEESPDVVRLAKPGLLTYPETGATFVVDVARVWDHERPSALGLRLSGPGIDGERSIWVQGWQAAWVEELTEKNEEFPLGVDTILVFENEAGEPSVCAMPRSTKITLI